MNRWLINVDGDQYSAASLEQLRGWIEAGRVPPHAHVYHPSLGDWLAVSELEAVAAELQQARRRSSRRWALWGCGLPLGLLLVIYVMILIIVKEMGPP